MRLERVSGRANARRKLSGYGSKRDFYGPPLGLPIERGIAIRRVHHQHGQRAAGKQGVVALLAFLHIEFSLREPRATLHRDGKPAEVLWRLSDHWADARPAGLSDLELDRREVPRILQQGLADKLFRVLSGAKRSTTYGLGKSAKTAKPKVPMPIWPASSRNPSAKTPTAPTPRSYGWRHVGE